MEDNQYGDPNRTGSGFVNLQQYLNANKDNDLEKSVAGGITAESQKAQDDLASQDKQFNQNANAARSDVDASGNSTTDAANSVLKRAQDDPGSLSDADYKQFTGTTSKTYAPQPGSQVGQKELIEAQTAESAGKDVNSEGGRYSLLQRYLGGNGGYTMGQQGLDNALLANSNGGQLRQAQRGTVGLVNHVNAVGQNEQNTDKQYATNDAAFHQNVNSALYGAGGNSATPTGGALGGVQKNIGEAVKQYNTNRDRNLAFLANGGQIGALPDYVRQDLEAQGAPGAGDATYDLPLGNFFSAGKTATVNNATTAAQAAQLNALYKLAGQNNSFISDPNQVGTYNPHQAIDFHRNDYTNAWTRARQIDGENRNRAPIDGQSWFRLNGIGLS